jgi:hypothetical protein
MKRRQFLRTVVAGMPLGALGIRESWGAVEPKPPAEPAGKSETDKKAPPAPPPEKLTITAETTLAEVVGALTPFTPAQIQWNPAQAENWARDYRFPPFLHGWELSCRDVKGTLNFLTGMGWEGSALPEEERGRAGENFRLARTPFVPVIAGQRYWVCNNRSWDWKWSKGTGQPNVGAGGVLTVSARLQPDGDVVARNPFSLGRIPDHFSLDTLLDLIKQQLGILVNVEGDQFVPVQAEGITRLQGMTAGDVRAVCGDLMQVPHTLGEWLSLLAIGLNFHGKPVRADWKWSCKEAAVTRQGRQETMVIYTLRDYAHARR